MNIIRFFLRYSRKTMILSIVAGGLSGASNAALLAVINLALRKSGSPSAMLVWSFAGLCLLFFLSRYISELLLNSLGQGALFTLRMELSRQILSVPLQYLEQFGAARLLAVLTDDVPTITATILIIPVLCISVTVCTGCLIYMGFLSSYLLAIVLGFRAVGIATYQYPILC